MTSHRDGVNPLRPYYRPPSIGESPEPISTPGPRPFYHGNATTGQYASKARDIFSDLDYKDYISKPSPSVVGNLKDLIDELLWRYTSVLLAQPFEVAKTVLQVRAQDDLGSLSAVHAEEQKARTPTYRELVYDQDPDSDSDQDEPAYFTSNVPATPTPSYPRSQRQRSPPLESPQTPAKASLPPSHLRLRRPDSILDVISQLWQKEGAWGVWKGSNASFLYTILQSLVENWSRSLLSALFNVPDIGVKDDVDRLVDIASPYPWASLFVAAAAAVATGLVLSPLDMVRTRLIVTSTARSARRTVATVRSLPSYFCPPSLVVPTILHSLVHPILTLSTPLVMRTHFPIDRQLSPTTFSLAKFFSSSAALFIKLPLETVLRRGQMAVLNSTPYLRTVDAQSRVRDRDDKLVLDTIIQPGSYHGILATMYTIVNNEGSHAVPLATAAARPKTPSKKGKSKVAVSETVYRKGQGLGGLWRGWKVSWYGLVGLWAAGVVGGGGGGEF